jgi:hypothetical protein
MILVVADTFEYINLTEVFIGLLSWCGPMETCVCVHEGRGDGEGVGSSMLSDIHLFLDISIFVYFFFFHETILNLVCLL